MFVRSPTLPPPPPGYTHTIHAALTRATQPSLGSIVLSALIITGIRILALLTVLLRALPAYLPITMRPWLQPVVIGSGFAVGYLENATSSLSTYGLIYTGLTGDPFFPSARRAKALTAAVNTSVAKYKKRFKTERTLFLSSRVFMLTLFVAPLTMLTYAPLTLTFPFALTTYLFVAHTLGAPNHALWASLLAGGVTALVGLFCVGLVKDTADTLYICYCIDQDAGQRRRNEVFNAVSIFIISSISILIRSYSSSTRTAGTSSHLPTLNNQHVMTPNPDNPAAQALHSHLLRPHPCGHIDSSPLFLSLRYSVCLPPIHSNNHLSTTKSKKISRQIIQLLPRLRCGGTTCRTPLRLLRKARLFLRGRWKPRIWRSLSCSPARTCFELVLCCC
jgi:hypothetical protein